MTTFTNLPLDILVLIFPLLEPKDFLSLCRTCSGFYQPDIRLESSYWSHATRSKFRVRNRPAVTTDGLHWQRLYKRLLTQSRVYTWGQNTHGCLGRNTGRGTFRRIPRRGRGPPRNFGPPTVAIPQIEARESNWPEEVHQDFGVIADLQCGGWSTSILNDKGILFSAGTLNGMSQYVIQEELKPMKYPPGFPQAAERYDPAVALKEFSSGRTHVLGLSDSGIVWSWYHITDAAIQVKFNNLDISVVDSSVRSVVAGWNKSSAYIKASGIVVWDTLQSLPGEDEAVDTREVSDWVSVPKTDYQRPTGSQREPDETTRILGKEVGEVTNYVVLEHFVVFATDIRKIFAARISWNRNSGIIHDTFELLELQALSGTDSSPAVTDVQGSFRSFAVFKSDAAVITTNQDYLEACSKRAFDNNPNPLPALTKIPALQSSGVTSIAFGDYHYHALHSDGSISSYGREPGGCGTLGLGGSMGTPIPLGVLRGIKYNPWNQDGDLLPHGYYKGRRIWFHPGSEEWLRALAQGGKDHDEAAARVRMCAAVPPVQGEVSEWIEQMGGQWDKRPEIAALDEDGLGAYFALSVAAAGWHSGALVLVNDKLVKAVSESCKANFKSTADAIHAGSSSTAQKEQGEFVDEEPGVIERTLSFLSGLMQNIWDLPADIESPLTVAFPRLKLENDVEMPGEIPFTEWKEAKPDWSKLNWRGDDFSGKVFGVEGWEIKE